uniref:Uncharacterized protein n=1 Tax=Medicago truncatula TaxID=3880 RepID=Q2HTL4_MEDTR|nr:hypothetical protein MtrDRAFT_AC150269g1v2 [Medicago truncatula]
MNQYTNEWRTGSYELVRGSLGETTNSVSMGRRTLNRKLYDESRTAVTGKPSTVRSKIRLVKK